jgi:HK97 family phage portal protein
LTFLSGGTLVTKTPVDIRGTSWFHGMPPMSSNMWPTVYSEIYKHQLWVYTVVNKLALGTARLPLPVYRRDELNRPRADDHPMARLLRNPNPGMSAFELWQWTSSTRDIFGNAAWYKKRQGGQVVGLYPLHPSGLTRAEGGGWDFRNGTLELKGIPDSDVVHFKHYNPDSTTWGLSPLEPLRQTLENEWHARNATSSFWQNGARPGVALSHPKSLSEPAQRRLKAQWDAAAAGSGKTGSTVILEEGMTPQVLTISAEEAQYVETRKLNREEVCGAYDVPPPAVHILDHATFSNITEQLRSVYRDTLAPRLRSFEATIEVDLRMAEWPNDDVYAEFLMDEVLRGDFEARQAALQQASHMTIAEKRKVENLPFIEGTDRIFLNTATLPLDAIDAQAAANTASAAPAIEAPPTEAVRTVMGRLSWQHSLEQVDPKVLTEGLDDNVKAAVLVALNQGGSVADLRDRLRHIGGT